MRQPRSSSRLHAAPSALAFISIIALCMGLAPRIVLAVPIPTVTQISADAAGDPAGPNKPSGFRITFSEAIDPASFDASDLSVATSTAASVQIGAFVPVTPG